MGYYGPDHVGRLRLIGQLQTRGYSLAAIKDLVDTWPEGRTLTDVERGGDHPPAVASDSVFAALFHPLAAASSFEWDSAFVMRDVPCRWRLSRATVPVRPRRRLVGAS